MTAVDNERKLLCKINVAFIPLMMLIQFFQFSDRGTLANAVAMGIFQDTHMTQNEFSWASAIVFLGHLTFQLPNAYFMHKLPIAKYLGFTVILWGILEGCTALASNFRQLAAVRFLLGMAEGSGNPALALVISTLYRRSEQPVINAIMIFSNAIAVVFGGVISYGISQMNQVAGISSWKWYMIIYGCATILVGIACFIFMPDTPYSKWLRLTDHERLITEERIRDNATVQSHTIKKQQVLEALKEPRLYCYTLIGFMTMTQNGCMVTFTTQIILTMGYSKTASLLLSGSRGITDALYLIIGIYASRHLLGQCLTATCACLLCMISALLLIVIPQDFPKLAGIYLFTGALIPVLMTSSISNNVSGYSKKITYFTFLIWSFGLGSFCGPLMLVEGQTPQYLAGLVSYVTFQLISALLFLYIRTSMKRVNDAREQMKLPPQPEYQGAIDDITDVENVHFRYRL
ncbi:MFS general substrate transporter [Lichtheimia hyalospora FSU 10163]|nr:MFS general substrate transporter [Lichtheimia hyalospora FSU 10163]